MVNSGPKWYNRRMMMDEGRNETRLRINERSSESFQDENSFPILRDALMDVSPS